MEGTPAKSWLLKRIFSIFCFVNVTAMRLARTSTGVLLPVSQTERHKYSAFFARVEISTTEIMYETRFTLIQIHVLKKVTWLGEIFQVYFACFQYKQF